MGAAAMVPLGAIQDLIARKWPMPEARAAELTQLLAAMPRNERVAGVLAATLLMPIADELLFRGALATGVARDRGRIAALFTTSITFGLVSCVGDLHYLPMFVLLGLLMGHARLATGSVLASIGAHFAWRLADLARDQHVAGTIDPLVTATYSYPPWGKATLAICSVATIAFALVLYRFGRVGGSEEIDERDDPRRAPPNTPGGSGGSSGGDRDDDEGEGEG
jgi:hypothetical protein